MCIRDRYRIEQENKPIEQHLAGYYDNQGVWHQQGLTPDQLKELTNRQNQLKEKERLLMLDRAELDVLSKAMADVQAKVRSTQEDVYKRQYRHPAAPASESCLLKIPRISYFISYSSLCFYKIRDSESF